MAPIAVSSIEPLGWWRWSGRVAVQPFADFVMVELFAPQKACQRLSHDVLVVLRDITGDNGVVELVRLRLPGAKAFFVFLSAWLFVTRRYLEIGEPELEHAGIARSEIQPVISRRFCAVVVGT